MRPKYRSDCKDGPRPCPWVLCRHHLLCEITPSGRLVLHASLETWTEDMSDTCALDIADRGRVPLQCIGDTLGLTRERIRQIEVEAVRKVCRRVKLGATSGEKDMQCGFGTEEYYGIDD